MFIILKIYINTFHSNKTYLRKLHIEEFNSFYLSPNIVRVIKSRRLRWAVHIARTEEGRTDFKILTRKLAGKRLLRKKRHRWEDNNLR